MKQQWLAKPLSVFALLVGIAWTQTGAAQAVSFTPPADNAAPQRTTGGASRGAFFTPPSDNAAPRRATGGASRGSFFTPPADNAAPQRTTGGASRGAFFTPPADNAAPQRTTGGASRRVIFTAPEESMLEQLNSESTRGNTYGSSGAIALASQSMLAILPESFYGTTLEERPTILAYVPASTAQTAVFSLKDEAKNLHYQMSVPVSSEGGLVKIQLPEAAPALEVGKSYQWYLALQLDGELTPASPFVDGWVKRIEPSAAVANALTQGNQLANIELLGAQGIWYDTAAQLAALHLAQPTNPEIAQHWDELLESVGLSEIEIAPAIQ